MKKNVLAALLGMAVLLATGLAMAGAPYVIKIAYGEPPDINASLEHVMGVAFKEVIERETDGKITVTLYPGGTLGVAETVIQQVQIGSLQACPIADAKLSSMFEPIQVLSIPYLFDNRAVAYKVLDGPLGKKIEEQVLAKTGVRIIAIGENGGFRSFSNNTREIRTPADMKGMKFRVMQSPILLNMVENLGAIPTAISFGELYTSIQTNVIQGQENPPAVIRAHNLNEIQPYFTLDQHTYSVAFLVISERWFKNLPADLQEAVLRAGREVERIHRETSSRWDGEAIADLRGRGMNIYEPTPEEILQFRNMTQSQAIEFLRKSIDNSWIDEALAEADKARAELGLK